MRSDPPGSSGAGADVAVGSHEGEDDQVAFRPLRAVDRAHHDALADEGDPVDQLVRARVSVTGRVRATATAHASLIKVEPWIRCSQRWAEGEA